MQTCLLKKGANVAICSRSPESVNKAVSEISLIADGKIIGSSCDVKNKEDYVSWINDMANELGGVDIFIPNVSAGGGMGSEKNWWENFEIDILGTVTWCRSRCTSYGTKSRWFNCYDKYNSCC